MNRWKQVVWIAFVIASLSGWVPMLIATFFPLEFKLAHGAELTIDAIVHSIVIVWLLGFNNAKEIQRMDASNATEISA